MHTMLVGEGMVSIRPGYKEGRMGRQYWDAQGSLYQVSDT